MGCAPPLPIHCPRRTQLAASSPGAAAPEPQATGSSASQGPEHRIGKLTHKVIRGCVGAVSGRSLLSKAGVLDPSIETATSV